MTEENVQETTTEETTTEAPAVETTEAEQASFMEELDEAIDTHIEEKENNDNEETDGNKAPLPEIASEEEKPSLEKPKVEDKEVKQEESREDVPVHDEALLERAVRAGLTLADANNMPDDQSLSNVIGRVEAAKQRRQKVPKEKQETDLLSEIPDLDPEEYPEEVISAFKGLKGAVSEQQKTIKALTQSQQNQQQAAIVARNEEFTEWFDGQVKDLGKDYIDTLGEGDYKSLTAKETKLARNKVIRYMDHVHNDAKAEGRKAPNDEDTFKLAVEKAFPDKTNKIKGRKITKKAAARSRQVLNTPRDTNGQFASEIYSEDTRTDDAIAAVAAMME